MSETLLEIRNATKVYRRGRSDVVALQDFSLTLASQPAAIVAIAGESGSGKTTLANLVLGFTRLTSGNITFKGQDISKADARQMKAYRRDVQAVFQDPFGVYNPYYRVGHVFDMVIRNFKLAKDPKTARDMIEEGLNAVGLRGEDVLRKYSHQLSGGQRQRVMMARAYMVKPKLIVADEPVSMVDASLRASILDVMIRLKSEAGISFLYITHDLSTAYQIGDQIVLLYQGTVAETGRATDVIDEPKHPYVQLLIESVPRPDPNVRWQGEITLPVEEEMRTSSKAGCRFYPRCPLRMDHCLTNLPSLYGVGKPSHRASCFLYDETVANARRGAAISQ
jgi:ABC-type dipeptide/oligopeptide/nickel transport system, ATPase component